MTLAAKKQIADGIDPSENKKAVKESKLASLANSFEVIAREWGQKKVDGWEEKNNRSKRMLERNVFPWLGSKPITEIRAVDILECLRRVEDRGAIETAHRTLQICGQVFRHGDGQNGTRRYLGLKRRIATRQRPQFCRLDGHQTINPAAKGN